MFQPNLRRGFIPNINFNIFVFRFMWRYRQIVLERDSISMRFTKDHKFMQLAVPRTRSTWLWKTMEGEFYDDISSYKQFVDDDHSKHKWRTSWPPHTPNWAVSRMFKIPRSQYKKFTVVRNPWERYASFYTRLLEPKSHKRQEHAMSTMVKQMTFSQFLIEIALGNRTYDLCTEVSFLLNDRAALDIDYVFRFENHADIKSFFADNGYSTKNIPIEAPNRPWREMYTANDIKIVENMCELDIRYFGYKFEP